MADDDNTQQNAIDQMTRFGLLEAKPPVEKPAEAPAAGASGLEIDGVKYTPEQLVGKITELEKTVGSLTGEDAKANKELTSKLLEAINGLGSKAKEEKPAVSQEQFDQWRQKMDEEAAQDYTGTTISLAKSVVESQIAPLLSKIQELTDTVNGINKAKEDENKSISQQKDALNNLHKSFKDSGLEGGADPKEWEAIISYYKDSLGIDVIADAYNNPAALTKKVSHYLKNVKGKSSANPGLGLPAGGGNPGSSQGAPEGDKAKVIEQMKRFGLS